SDRSCGIIATHGGHQKPQKSRTTTLPLYSLSLKVLPVVSLPVISGARLPTSKPIGALALLPPPEPGFSSAPLSPGLSSAEAVPPPDFSSSLISVSTALSIASFRTFL